MRKKYYTPDEDKSMIIFWLIAGGIVAAVAGGSIFPLLLVLAATYGAYRCIDNIESGKPISSPGKYSRHLNDSIDRLADRNYGGYYRRRIKRSRYY